MQKRRRSAADAFEIDKEGNVSVLGWPGNDLLSRVLRHSTIGAEEFNGRVRDGIGFGLLARATGPAKDRGFRQAAAQQPSSDLIRGPRYRVLRSLMSIMV